MKNSIAFLFLCTLFSCNTDKKKAEVIQQDTAVTTAENKIPVVEENILYTDRVFNCIPTTDAGYCDSTKFSDTVCGAALFLSKNKNAVFNAFCEGEEEIDYVTGTYIISGEEIVCTFTKKISTAGGRQFGDIEMKEYSVRLKKLTCGNYRYGFTEPGDYKYLLESYPEADQAVYLQEMRRISALSSL